MKPLESKGEWSRFSRSWAFLLERAWQAVNRRSESRSYGGIGEGTLDDPGLTLILYTWLSCSSCSLSWDIAGVEPLLCPTGLLSPNMSYRCGPYFRRSARGDSGPSE